MLAFPGGHLVASIASLLICMIQSLSSPLPASKII